MNDNRFIEIMLAQIAYGGNKKNWFDAVVNSVCKWLIIAVLIFLVFCHYQ